MIQFNNIIFFTIFITLLMEAKQEIKENQNIEIKEKFNNPNSLTNQSDTTFEEIEIADAREDDDEDDDEIEQKLHIPPNLIYLYQNNSPHFAKDDSNGFIDSMSDIFLIESLSIDNFKDNQTN